jgi:hypothetical protein
MHRSTADRHALLWHFGGVFVSLQTAPYRTSCRFLLSNVTFEDDSPSVAVQEIVLRAGGATQFGRIAVGLGERHPRPSSSSA